MFSLVSATVLASGVGAQWEVKDISDISVKEILSVYRKVFLTLSHPESPSDFYFDMDNWQNSYPNYTGTISELLVSLGDASLPFVPVLPNSNIKYVKYALGVRHGYNALPVNIGQELPMNYPLGSLMDIRIERDRVNYPDSDLTLLHSKCLITVDGLIHWTEADETFTYIKDGAKTMRHTNTIDFGILSFMGVGNITKVKIDENNITSHLPDVPLLERVIINVPNINLENKSYILVLGGYFVFPQEGVFWRNSDSSFALNIQQINYLERYLESRDTLDYTSFNLTVPEDATDSVLLGELLSDFIIKKYLTLSQSFLIVVDTNEMVRSRIPINKTDVPGKFVSYQDPTYPLIVGFGRVADYWKEDQGGRWSVSVVDGVAKHYTLSTQRQTEIGLINGKQIATDIFKSTEGYLLQLGGYNLEVV